MLLMQRVARTWIDRGGGGRTINISSSSAFRARNSPIAYATSKAAIVQLTRRTAAELRSYDINLNPIAPGITATAQTIGAAGELQRVASSGALENLFHRVSQPEDVAEAVLFLCASGSRQITGQTIHSSVGAVVEWLIPWEHRSRERPKLPHRLFQHPHARVTIVAKKIATIAPHDASCKRAGEEPLNWLLRHEFSLGANYQPTSLRLLAYSRRRATWKKFSLGAIEAVSGKQIVADSNRDTQAGRIETFDAIVVGAGVPGLYQLYRLREQGLNVRCVEDGSGVGRM